MSINFGFNQVRDLITGDDQWTTVAKVGVPNINTVHGDIVVVARDENTGVSALWKIFVFLQRDAGSIKDPLFPIFQNYFEPVKDLEAAKWDIQVIAEGNDFIMQVKGDLGAKIGWIIDGDIAGLKQ